MPENEAIWYLITLIPNQWESGFNGVYALKLSAYIEVANCLGIHTGVSFFEKLKIYEREVLRIIRDRNRGETICDEKQKQKCQFEFGEFFEWACENCEK